MKVVIQSNSGPYGLSRRGVEAACSVLPDGVVREIDQLVLVADKWGVEPFEYDPKRRVAYFAYPGDSNTKGIREDALRELLLGFARVEAGAEFRIRLTDRQRSEFGPFIDQWFPACLEAIKDEGDRGIACDR